jgi:hypothetical protein
MRTAHLTATTTMAATSAAAAAATASSVGDTVGVGGGVSGGGVSGGGSGGVSGSGGVGVDADNGVSLCARTVDVVFAVVVAVGLLVVALRLWKASLRTLKCVSPKVCSAAPCHAISCYFFVVLSSSSVYSSLHCAF